MAKLWDKGYPLDELIEQFTVGEDHLLDKKLINADCAGSIAHAVMLESINILTQDEFDSLKNELLSIIKSSDVFTITVTDEDVHTAIENHLTEKLGDMGKKIHTGRSRNDQVIVDIRLYAKGFLLAFKDSVLGLAESLHGFSEKHKDIPMVGRTHMQVAMPSSVGLWAAAFAESLLDDMEMLNTAFRVNDQCPLGSAASYGVHLQLDREMVSELLGFAKVQNNVLYVNNSRGKIESMILQAVQQVGLTLSKMAQDLILFSMPEFGYFTLPEELCSGSSIMPQKKNPCCLELVRAKTAVIGSCSDAVLNIIKGLPSGYNRDFQETKGLFIKGIETGIACVDVCRLVIDKLAVNKEKCILAFTPEVFAADRALELVAEGMPFRDAYKKVGTELDKLKNRDPLESIKKKTHTGTTGNLNLDIIKNGIKKNRELSTQQSDHFSDALKKLTGMDVKVYKKPFQKE